MTASRTPPAASRRSWWIRKGSPATSSSGLGTSRASSPRRVPRPPARMHTGGGVEAGISDLAPVQAAVAWHDPPQGVDVGVEILAPLGQLPPRVPDGAQQLAGDAVAGWRAEEDRELGRLLGRHPAAALLLERALVDPLPQQLRPGVEQPAD